MKIRAFLLVVVVALCAFPALAQDTPTNTVSFNGISFSFSNEIASNVNIAQVAGQDLALEQPGGPIPAHTEFTLFNDTLDWQGGYYGEGTINVYNTADFASYEESLAELAKLQSLLADRPDLSALMVASDGTNAEDLPYLPVVGAAQMLRAQAQYVDSATLQGVSYVTAFRQDVAPFTGSEFRYTFQGLSSDGASYVSVVIYLDTALFPAEIPTDYDYEALAGDFTTYLNESITTLNGGTADDFTPSLTTLNTLVQSISVSGTGSAPPRPATTVPATVAPTATVGGDPLMGGLAGKTWTLVSYGNADAPQTVVEGSTVTLLFSETGVSGNAGCNSYGGSFTFDATTLTIGQTIRTLMACEEPLMTQEDAYLAALATASAYTLSENQLMITYEGGTLTFMVA